MAGGCAQGAGRKLREMSLKSFYRVVPTGDGLADVYLTPCETKGLTGVKGGSLLVLRGVNPDDAQWGGSMEESIRENYASWLASAEEIEIT